MISPSAIKPAEARQTAPGEFVKADSWGLPEPYDLGGKRVWVAGHRGMAGSAVVRRLAAENVGELVLATSGEVDLTRQADTERFVADAEPDVAIIAAARVGGVHANRSAQGTFLYDKAESTGGRTGL